MSRQAIYMVAIALLVVLALGGCGSSSGTTAGSTSGGEQHEPQAGSSAAAVPVQRAAAAKGRQPGGPKGAAGACGQARGGVPTLTIQPDVPSPRCMVVAAGQRLRVLNEAGGGDGGAVVIDFAGFHAAVPAGGSVILAAPFGSYLAPGSHYLQVHGGPGPAEIRLAR